VVYLRQCATFHELSDNPEFIVDCIGREILYNVRVIHPFQKENFAQVAKLVSRPDVLHLLHGNTTLR